MLSAAVACGLGGVVVAQELMPEIAPDATSPLAEPVVRAEAFFKAERVTTFALGAGRGLLLEGDVEARVGSYGFRGDRAVVRIDEQSLPGQMVRHVSIYFDNARPLLEPTSELFKGRTTAAAPRLLVTAATVGEVNLETALLERGDAIPQSAFVAEAQDRFARYFEGVAARTLAVPANAAPIYEPGAFARREARREEIRREQRSTLEGPVRLAEGDRLVPTRVVPPPKDELPPQASQMRVDRGGTVLPVEGVVGFTADRIVYEPAPEGAENGESTLTLIGDVSVVYEGFNPRRSMSLKAQQVVIFLDAAKAEAPSDAEDDRLDAGAVKGVYLEDDVVVTDGQFTLRSPRVYYDVAGDKAVVLDAVLYTWDAKMQVPLYLRAEKLRQESVSSWSAQDAKLTTSEFGRPHFHIGASRVTINEAPRKDGTTTTRFAAKGTTLNYQGLPFFYWPGLSGNAEDTALERVTVGYNSDTGPEVRTRWDLFALAGRQKPDGVSLRGDLDYRGDHGPAIGGELDYTLRDMFGSFNAYFLPLDNGADTIGGRQDIEHDNDIRGFGSWRHRQRIREKWELSLEGAYVSDETFLEEFFPSLATEEKPFETSLYLKRQNDTSSFDFLVKSSFNDFLPQTTILQSFGYDVEKMPELGYYQVGTSLWDNRLTYYTENRLSRMRVWGDESTPADRGFRDSVSQELFGFPPNRTFEQELDAAGVTEADWVHRFDTRHEIQAPFEAGILSIVPYVSGRVTAYDDDFSEFAGNDDNIRLLGTVGTRVATQFSRGYNAESRMLDVHRLRHIVEPYADVFITGSTVESDELPVFDPDVEGLSEGPGVRLGVRNTFQTQRGGEGRWRSVDWLVIDSGVVVRGDDANTDAEIARFFGYRPEYSVGGDHFYTDVLWMISDTLALVGDINYNLENQAHVAQWRTGLTLDHSPRLTSFVTYGEIDILSSRLLTYGFVYQLTTKYTGGVSHTVDFGPNEDSRVNLWLERKLPRWRLRLFAQVDQLGDDQSIGISLLPEGLTDTALPSFGGTP